MNLDNRGVGSHRKPRDKESNEDGELAICLALVAILTAALPHRADLELPTSIDWPSLLAIAQKTKTFGLLRKGLQNLHVTPSGSAAAYLKSSQEEILRLNLANIARAVRIVRTLEEAGVGALVLKGPLRSEEVYGMSDMRSASDIDILVRQSEYRHSIAALRELGYSCLVMMEDRWWHDFLGESPFVNFSSPGPSIDLHNQLQQPGGPYPSNVEDFFNASQLRSVGRQNVAILSCEHALILTAISFCKAVRSGDPWLSYAHELRYCLLTPGGIELQQLRACAKSQGVLRLFDHFENWTTALFDKDNSYPSSEPESKYGDLVLSSCGFKRLPPFGRTKAMWRWSDGEGVSRMKTFVKIFTRDFRSKLAFRKSSQPAIISNRDKQICW